MLLQKNYGNISELNMFIGRINANTLAFLFLPRNIRSLISPKHRKKTHTIPEMPRAIFESPTLVSYSCYLVLWRQISFLVPCLAYLLTKLFFTIFSFKNFCSTKQRKFV